jgi:hypothetical protein
MSQTCRECGRQLMWSPLRLLICAYKPCRLWGRPQGGSTVTDEAIEKAAGLVKDWIEDNDDTTDYVYRASTCEDEDGESIPLEGIQASINELNLTVRAVGTLLLAALMEKKE